MSMPYGGLSSFLLRKIVDKHFKGTCVNALWRAFFISTANRALIEAAKKVSMPYGGLSSFLQEDKYEQFRKPGVSMPYGGLSSFLQVLMGKEKDSLECQCPMAGFLHFYSDKP